MKQLSKNRKITFEYQKGISLIEILVTVLIIAIGGLGIASLQLAGLKYSSGSYARTQAVILADDIANRLKTNRDLALDLDNDGNVGGNSPYTIGSFAATVTSARDCLTDDCNPTQLATYDLATWLDEIARALPAGRGRIITVDEANPDGVIVRNFEIGLQWRQVANSSTPGDTGALEPDEVKEVIYRISI